MFARTWVLCFLFFCLTQFPVGGSIKVPPAEKANFTTLRLVQIIARHGDRAPILPYPNDQYRDASVYSINGWGELSEIGAKQVYELGSYLRQRYDGFLPRKYRKRDFLMISSDIDRAIMSAEANLAGLYELGPLPRSRDIFREWQPVPIHTIPEEEDNFLNGNAPCPRYHSLFKQFFDSDEFKTLLEENKAFIDFIVQMSGLTAINTDFQEIFQVQDALRCQHLHNLTLPTWANTTVYEKLQYFKALSFTWNVRTDEMKVFKAGPLFERLVEKMKAKVGASNLILDEDNEVENEILPYQDPIAYRKMYIYSGHDSTITAILESLNLFQPPHVPPYASALIIELHKIPSSGEFFVEILYKNDTTREPYKLDLTAFCGNSSYYYCSYQDFSNFVHKFIPTDWKAECQLQTLSSSSGSLLSAPSGSIYKPALMRIAPADRVNVVEATRQDIDENAKENSMIALHPLGVGITASGLSGFLLAVLVVLSLSSSVALLLFFLTRRSNVQLSLNSLYHNLS